jgi:hypothetical protein
MDYLEFTSSSCVQEKHLWSLATHFYLGFNLATQILKNLDYFFLGISRFEVLDGMAILARMQVIT